MPSDLTPPEPPRAAAAPAAATLETLNTAVVDWFDSTTTWLAGLPANPISDFLSGALLLIRRTLFNQLPTAAPAPLRTTSAGQFEGTLGMIDAEGDSLRYTVLEGPTHGTVQINADGTYLYTSAESSAGYGDLAVSDSFTVSVADSGFNLLMPASNRTVDVRVNIGPDPDSTGPEGTVVGATRGFDIINLTRYTLTLSDVRYESGYDSSWAQSLPKIGTTYGTGDSLHAEIKPYFFSSWDTRLVFTAKDASGNPVPDTWTVKLNTDIGSSSEVSCEIGQCSYYQADAAQGRGYPPRRILLTENAGTAGASANLLTLDIAPDSPGSAELLRRLLEVSNRLAGADNCADASLQACGKGLNPKFTNIKYNTQAVDLQGAAQVTDSMGKPVSLDNRTSVNQGTLTLTWQGQAESQKTGPNSPWWKQLADKELKKALALIPFIGDDLASVLTFDNIFGQPITKGDLTAPLKLGPGVLPLAVPAWSTSAILVPGPTIYSNGDIELTLKTCANPTYCSTQPNSGGTAGPKDLIKWTFRNMDFDFPNKFSKDQIRAEYRTEPLQPDNSPNVGLSLRDEKTDSRTPTYSQGQEVELYLTAFNGNSKDGSSDFSSRACSDATKTSCTTFDVDDKSVLAIEIRDGFAYVTGLKPGKAKVTATYSYLPPAIPGGRPQQAIATMEVTVIPQAPSPA